MINKPIPILILTGFLGSGKTTLLQSLLRTFADASMRPAVIMNEIGDVNLDGQLVDSNIPMAEMLSGCICCTIRGDLSLTVQELIQENKPDVILIESTGVANPMEIMEAVTDTSLLLQADLKTIITVVDAPHLLALSRRKRSKTLQLIQDQVRCANRLVLNKSDLVTAGELYGLESFLREWNPYARIQATSFCQVDTDEIEQLTSSNFKSAGVRMHERMASPSNHDHSCGHDHFCEHQHSDGIAQPRHHHSHDHVMVYTHYFDRPLNMDLFDTFVSHLPKEVYRAKGILKFTGSDRFHLFQYAYKEMDILKINPQKEVQLVAVFIGENFSKTEIQEGLNRLH